MSIMRKCWVKVTRRSIGYGKLFPFSTVVGEWQVILVLKSSSDSGQILFSPFPELDPDFTVQTITQIGGD